ncbi:MAG: LamG domain-containing protein, partial [bacterium]
RGFNDKDCYITQEFKKGSYKFKARFEENAGDDGIAIGWIKPNKTEWEYIPIEYFSTLEVTNGKIGECYKFIGNDDEHIKLPNKIFQNMTDYTISCWVNSSNISKSINTIFHGTNTGGNDISVELRSDRIRHIIDGTFYDFMKSFSSNIWYHITTRREGSKLSLFINGEFIEEKDCNESIINIDGYLLLGQEQDDVGGGFVSSQSLEGLLNDVRIYNNAISDKEIKELSKCKILHYTFNEFQEPTENLFLDGDFNGDNPMGMIIHSSGGVNNGYYGETTPNGGSWDNQLTLIWEENKYFTLSGYVKKGTDTALQARVVPHMGDDDEAQMTVISTSGCVANANSYSIYLDITDDWQYWSVTYFVDIGGSGPCYFLESQKNDIDTVCFDKIQLEEKDHATPFVNSIREGKVIDCSGYNHHANLELNITPIWVEDSKIGTGCYESSIYPTYIDIPYGKGIDMSKFHHTISMWVKPNVIEGNNIFFASNNGSNQRLYLSIYDEKWDIGIQGSAWSTELSKTSVATEWTHVALIMNGNNAKLYINGDFSMSKSYTSYNLDSDFRIHMHYTMSSSYQYYGKIDDLRIYGTALSEDDIKELYDIRGGLDNKGNLYGSQFNSKEYNIGRIDPVGGSHSYNAYMGILVKNHILLKSVIIQSYYEGELILRLQNDSTDENSFKTKEFNIDEGVQKLNIEWVLPPGDYKLYRENSSETPLRRLLDDERMPFINDDVEIYHDSNHYYYYFDIKYTKVPGINEKSIINFNEFNEVGPSKGLVGWWPLNDNTFDYSGNLNYGINNDAIISSGLRQNCYEFDGDTSYIELSKPLDDFFSSSFTVNMWCYFNDDSRGILFGDYQRPNSSNINFEKYTDRKMRFYWAGNPDIMTSANVFSLNEWCLLTFMRDKENSKVLFYVNNELVHTYNDDIDDKISQSLHLIGRDNRTGVTTLDGKIQDVRIYNRALSSEEIGILYKLGQNNIGMQLS